ncbi:uncharacterized protein LOC111634871 isoform X1 [Centruroides sculpturatus]|uniref:uncharacterized protein LOC111634871 isoform X1 n=1 Tax=Centruroides sculpturatus TaxID=218467 RepID=UPI000C6D6CF8|nr:uncharacterized protein LOC111634871 isoform X1 [Centruroides sculpturatus]
MVAELSEYWRPDFDDCIENLAPDYYKNKFKNFSQCVGKNSLFEVINIICESKKQQEDLEAKYSDCFSIMHSKTENEYDISFTIAMKIYILFFSAFLLCKIAGRANTKSIYSSQKTDICDFPEFFTTKVYNCVENLSFHNYRDKLGHFIRCFRKDSFSEVINTLCESNKSMNEIQREYPHCFAIFSLEDEINISSIHEDLMNCIFSNK